VTNSVESLLAPLGDYERQVNALLADVRAGDVEAVWRFKWNHPESRNRSVADLLEHPPTAAAAQLVVAHEHAFDGWTDLESFNVEVKRGGPVARFEAAAHAVVNGDVNELRSLLDAHPELIRARSSRRHHATLLHYVAANGVEGGRQRTPPNAVAVARLLLDAGAEVDALADMYGAKCTTMSMLVSSSPPAEAGSQCALAETLLDYGAALTGPGTAWQSALMTSLVFGFPETAEMLASRGPPLNDIAAAAGLGRLADVVRLLPGADGRARHCALALAAHLGRREIVELLLDAGEDPDRFDPEGMHSHATPLHQAISSDHLETVKLLVERGARLDIRDRIFDGTPLGWAEHLGKEEIAGFLRSRGAPR
jgi:hypothetical protein